MNGELQTSSIDISESEPRLSQPMKGQVWILNAGGDDRRLSHPHTPVRPCPRSAHSLILSQIVWTCARSRWLSPYEGS